MCLPPTSADTLPHFATKWAQDFRTSADEDKDVSSLSTAAPESITDEVAGQVREGVLLRFDINGSPGDSVPHEDRLYVVLGTKYKVMTVFQAPTSELPTVRRDAEALLRSLRVE